MKKYIFTIVLIGFVFTFTENSIAQISLQVGAGAGITMPSSDLKGSTEEYFNGKNYGLSNGYNFHGKVRVGLLSFNLAGILDYSSMSNDGSAQSDGRGKLEVSQNIFSLRVGPEFTFSLPMLPITPYIFPNVSYNNISGETVITGTDRVASGTYDLESATRFGAGITGGVILSFLPVKIDVGVHYNMINLMGKEWKDMNAEKDQRIDTYLSLNDDKDPLYSAGSNDHVVSDSRSIGTLQITVTALFGL